MTRIHFVCPYPLGKSPSQRFRFEQYFICLKELPYVVEIHPFMSSDFWNVIYNRGNYAKKIRLFLAGFFSRCKLLLSIKETDYVFIHREAMPIGPPFFEWMIARVIKAKVIYDFDDAIWIPQVKRESSIVRIVKNPSKVNSIIRWSWKISCGNLYLAEHASKYNSSVIVNPTTVDVDTRHNKIKDQGTSKIVIGWTGSHSTLMYLEPLIPVLEKVYKIVPFDFRLICNKPLLHMPSFATFVPWVEETEIEDLLEFNIGVMPLINDDWTKGKCGFKAIQYMSLGIPAIVSSVGVNSQIVDNGINGYLCETEKEWEFALLSLLNSKSLREKMGAEARIKIIENYSVVSNKSNFLSLFQQ